jgi:hypothetical protein
MGASLYFMDCDVYRTSQEVVNFCSNDKFKWRFQDGEHLKQLTLSQMIGLRVVAEMVVTTSQGPTAKNENKDRSSPPHDLGEATSFSRLDHLTA